MDTPKKYQFVLIHGAWHGAWCWEKVVPLLKEAGHQVHTIDLPGLGEDQTPISEVTLDAYVCAAGPESASEGPWPGGFRARATAET